MGESKATLRYDPDNNRLLADVCLEATDDHPEEKKTFVFMDQESAKNMISPFGGVVVTEEMMRKMDGQVVTVKNVELVEDINREPEISIDTKTSWRADPGEANRLIKNQDKYYQRGELGDDL